MPSNSILITALIGCLTCTLVLSANEADTFHIAVEPWPGFSAEDGTGVYHTLWNETFKDSRFKIKMTYVPYARSIALFNSGLVDGIGAAYPISINRSHIVPHWRMGQSYVSVVVRKDAILEFTDSSQLSGEPVVWIRGYDFDKAGIIKENIKLHEVPTISQAYDMLKYKRVRYLIDYSSEWDHLVKTKKIDPSEFTIFRNVIPDVPYHFVIQNTEKGREVRDLWDKALERLYKSGQLQKLWRESFNEDYPSPENK